jgi:hypothetical protein
MAYQEHSEVRSVESRKVIQQIEVWPIDRNFAAASFACPENGMPIALCDGRCVSKKYGAEFSGVDVDNKDTMSLLFGCGACSEANDVSLWTDLSQARLRGRYARVGRFFRNYFFSSRILLHFYEEMFTNEGTAIS